MTSLDKTIKQLPRYGSCSHGGGMNCCTCGCEYFVWWIEEQGRYSSPTRGEHYKAAAHPYARCYRCNLEWVEKKT